MKLKEVQDSYENWANYDSFELTVPHEHAGVVYGQIGLVEWVEPKRTVLACFYANFAHCTVRIYNDLVNLFHRGVLLIGYCPQNAFFWNHSNHQSQWPSAH